MELNGILLKDLPINCSGKLGVHEFLWVYSSENDMIGWVIRGLLLGLITTIAVIVVGKVTLALELQWNAPGDHGRVWNL